MENQDFDVGLSTEQLDIGPQAMDKNYRSDMRFHSATLIGVQLLIILLSAVSQ